jgi:GAF domain-containing protein
MPAAPIPDNENLRLAILHSLTILDTPLEERYERITRLLSRTLDMPMAALAFVDAERQWMKSVQGSDVVEVPREHSFCAHTILRSESLIINDTLKDARFADNPMVIGEQGIRFYAGTPLTIGDDVRVGALCVYDTRPRELNAEDISFLEDFAETAASELKARLMQLVYKDVI